ncbi:MAG: prepilin-type N-terminal cleavage/methylation domain-containing protein [Planctomycetota bacterium]|nr:MAG: prepilin-type N-terminal cleavage/methylation domain-containing protein [Planctomycetota bacterium]
MGLRKGFTLVELLVVIAIIALLMSILMPALARVRNQAKAVLCLSNLKQWGLVFSMYTEDNNGRFMSGTGGECWDGGMGYWWMTPLKPYYRDKKIRLCPMATKPYYEGSVPPFGAWYTGCDEVGGYRVDIGSYAPNGWICNPPLGWATLWDRPTDFNWRLCTVPQAATIPLFLDALWVDAWPLAVDDPQPVVFWLADEVNLHEMRRFCVNRHDGYVNVVFLDFSTVRRVGLKELWRLKWHTKYELDAPSPVWPPWMRRLKDY